MTYEGSISKTIENLAALLAICPSWQTWTKSTGDTAAAKAAKHIHPVDLPVPTAGVDLKYERAQLEQLRPLIIIDTTETPGGLVRQKFAEAVFGAAGKLTVQIEDNVPPELMTDPAGAKLWFLNRVGQLIDDICELAGNDGRFNVTEIGQIGDVFRTDFADVPTLGDRWVALLLISHSNY